MAEIKIKVAMIWGKGGEVAIVNEKTNQGGLAARWRLGRQPPCERKKGKCERARCASAAKRTTRAKRGRGKLESSSEMRGYEKENSAELNALAGLSLRGAKTRKKRRSICGGRAREGGQGGCYNIWDNTGTAGRTLAGFDAGRGNHSARKDNETPSMRREKEGKIQEK